MNHTHIEFCHIYADQPFGQEQIVSVERTLDLIYKLKKQNLKFVTSILIDELNINGQNLGFNRVLNSIRDFGIQPNFVAFESRFTSISDLILKQLPNTLVSLEKFKNENKKVVFLNSNGKKIALADIYQNRQIFKCAILSSAWLLCRLGVFKFPGDSIIEVTNSESIEAERIISVLPKKYEIVEEHVARIVTALGYENELSRVSYVYY